MEATRESSFCQMDTSARKEELAPCMSSSTSSCSSSAAKSSVARSQSNARVSSRGDQGMSSWRPAATMLGLERSVQKRSDKAYTGLRYLKTRAALLNLFTSTVALAALLALLTMKGEAGGYATLPLAWHLRLFVLFFVVVFLTLALDVLVIVAGLVNAASLPRLKLEVCLHVVLTCLTLLGSSLVASAVDFYRDLSHDVKRTALRHLTTAAVLGYVCFLASVAAAVRTWLKVRHVRNIQFQRLVESVDR